jgi:hypothetical protein
VYLEVQASSHLTFMYVAQKLHQVPLVDESFSAKMLLFFLTRA